MQRRDGGERMDKTYRLRMEDGRQKIMVEQSKSKRKKRWDESEQRKE